MYRELEAYDSFMTICMPPEVKEFVEKTLSLNLSGVPFSGEGPDFKLESVNKNVQHFLPPVPGPKDWQIACSNYDDLHMLKRMSQDDMGMPQQEGHGRTPPNIELQARAFRVKLREKEYLSNPCEKVDHVSLSGKALDKEAVRFCELAKEKRSQYIDAFCAHYTGVVKTGSVRFKTNIVCITQEEREMLNDINRKTVSEITDVIQQKLTLVCDEDVRGELSEDFQRNVLNKKGKKARKEDYLSFNEILDELLEAQRTVDNLPSDESQE